MDKTEYMIAGSRQRINNIENDPDIRLGNDNIKRVKETKTLGIIIEDQLKWNTHIDNVVAKVRINSTHENVCTTGNINFCL